MNKLLSLIKFFIGWPLSIISLAFIFKVIIEKSSISIFQIKHIDVSLLIISVVCFLIYFSLRSLLWKKIIKEKGIAISSKENAYLWGISELKRYVPGNIWSFVSRSFLFEKKGLSKKEIAKCLLAEAEFIILASLILSIPAIFLFVQDRYINSAIFALFSGLVLFFVFNKKLYFSEKIQALLPYNSFESNFYLLITSFFSFLFFSLGTYFATISIIYLNLYYVVQYVSIFALSLLIGYLSFITPMGLGVREGVITFSLSRFTSVSLAGLSAIFSRLVFMISEILFIVFVFLWNKIKSKNLDRLENFISNYKYELVLLLSVVIYIVYFTSASFLRYDNFFTGRFDLGNMDQAVWNTFHGRIFQITDPNGTSIISRLSFHADFILILIAPLYKIWANPKTLLFLQSFVLGFGAIFVYLLAKEVLKKKSISLVFSLAFLLSPAVSYSNLYDFHPVTLATTLLLATTYFFIKRKYLLFIVFAVLAALTKEQVWAIVSIYGLILLFYPLKDLLKNKNLKKKPLLLKSVLGIVFFALTIGIFYYLVWYAIPYSRGGEHFALSYYSDFGNSPTSVIKNIIFEPDKTFLTIFSYSKIYYLYQMFVHLGFLSIFSPVFLLFAIPDLLVNTLSSNAQLHQIYYQYTTTITPFIFISAIYGIDRLRKIFPKIPLSFYAIFLTFTVFYSAYTLGPLPGTLGQSIDMFNKPLPEKEIINNYLKNIGPKYSIAATNNLGSHLSHRQKIFTIPVGIDQADIILFLLNDKFAQPSLAAQIEIANKLKRDKNYVQVFRHRDFVVFEKKNLYLEKKPNSRQINLFPWSITSLQNREYTDSQIMVERKVSLSKNFSSFIVSYLSDGLKLYALMNIPNSKMPENGFPVVIINHGYIKPSDYSTINSYKNITDYFSENGYLVLKPDYRGNGTSETEDNALMRFAYPVDVLNLIESLKNIPQANSNEVYLYGHSMGGEIVLKVLEIAGKKPETLAKIKAAVVWAPVADLPDWFSKTHVPWLQETKNNKNYYAETFKIMKTPEENPILWQSVSPINYLQDIQTPIQINHGLSDGTVPYRSSIELYDNLISLNKTAQLLTYPDNNHNLVQSWNKAAANGLSFFKKY